MSELLKKQNYGVEVEFTGISRKMAADAVAEIIGTTASRPDHTCYQTRTIQDSQGRKWKVMRDSSINPIRKVGTENMDEYRVEFVTPVLKYEDLDTLQAIIRKFREIGGVPHAKEVSSTLYFMAPATGATYLNDSPSMPTFVFELADAFARTSEKCPASFAFSPKAVKASVTISEVLARSSPEAAARLIIPDIPAVICSGFQPAIAM